MKIKAGVTLHGLTPQMTVALLAAYDAYSQYGTELVITSGNDGRHSVTSKHYAGNAIDLRTRNLPRPQQDAVEIADILNTSLGRDFDVLFEGDHIHVEYDPKRPD